MMGVHSDRRAYLAPFVVFLAFLLLESVVKTLGDGYAHWALSQPRYWILPLQTLVCSVLLWKLRSRIALRPFTGFGFATLIGLLALVVWIAPQAFLGFPPRTEGFHPDFFGAAGFPYWANLTVRIFRMTVVVAFVEELFWRGFLLRFLVNENFASVPFGTFTWRSFLISSFAFCIEHERPDWPAAIVTGALFNLVAYRTRSLAACVLTHAVTNLALAFYVLRTGQWGFW
jgi:CAAX prenyl protease-like protein